ncbi:MAG TPA: hypothetical protein VG077_11150 [Verrucomicrobiae bacterium]|nr:hypothetical protein [Verrucomicrobiae bacterium]
MKKLLRRLLFIFLSLAVLIALFYAEEDWRGKRAWENCRRELEARGEVLDWSAYLPPPVPDEKNVFKVPKIAEWFVGRGETDLSKRLENPKSGWFGALDQITNEVQAKDYLAWSDQFESDFDLIHKALKRPYARMDGDYAHPFETPVPNFVTVRIVAQTLAQRAHCYFLLNRPEPALKELTLVHDICRLLQGAPTGKPMTLVSAMINVAISGLYAETMAEGFQKNVWRAPQLPVLQEQLKDINLATFMVEAFKSERAEECHFFETIRQPRISNLFSHNRYPGDKLTFRIFLMRLKDLLPLDPEDGPHGWIYQNMVTIAKFDQKVIDDIDLTNNLVMPRKIDRAQRELEKLEKLHGPYTFIAAIAIPNFAKAWQTAAYHQTMVNEAQIACAMERYRLVHGEYPLTLNVLTPQFIEKLPHDIIGGRPSQGPGSASQPLHYRRMSNGKFLLYSVGWNETDDKGQVAPMKDGRSDLEIGDWVWEN